MRPAIGGPSLFSHAANAYRAFRADRGMTVEMRASRVAAGMAIGIGAGAAFGAATGDMAVSVAAGAALGAAFGALIGRSGRR